MCAPMLLAQHCLLLRQAKLPNVLRSCTAVLDKQYKRSALKFSLSCCCMSLNVSAMQSYCSMCAMRHVQMQRRGLHCLTCDNLRYTCYDGSSLI